MSDEKYDDAIAKTDPLLQRGYVVRDGCACLATSHDHTTATGENAPCPRSAKVVGGDCTECHYWATFDRT